jgi:hypothetical protein
MHLQPPPGEWPAGFVAHDYRRLVAIARRWLHGHDHLAEDVVSRAMIRWQRTSPTVQRARIEMLIRSEAATVLRSEYRRKGREMRMSRDRSSPFSRLVHRDEELSLRRIVADHCRRQEITLTTLDIEVFELLLSGASLAETARILGLQRYEAKVIRLRWRRILAELFVEE